MKNKFQFQDGGTLSPKSKSYIVRPADKKLLESLEVGELCIVLASRQTGKSSLMMRTIVQLREKGIKASYVDFQAISTTDDMERWLTDIVFQIGDGLDLDIASENWWKDYKDIYLPAQRFTEYLKKFILEEIKTNVVIFFDEIDSALDRPFSDEFFKQIRSIYNARANSPTLKRLTFSFLGVAASQSALISDQSFNVGKNFSLQDFSREALQLYEQAFGESGKTLIDRIYYWTDGQPFLVQKLAATMYALDESEHHEQRLDREVQELIPSDEVHFQHIQRILTHNKKYAKQALEEYFSIIKGETKKASKLNSHNLLKVSGVVKNDHDNLIPRNRIYRSRFNAKWVMEQINQLGGSLYIERNADIELSKYLKKMDLCLVSAPRQSGKTMMVDHVIDALSDTHTFVWIDCQNINQNDDIDRFFQTIIQIISEKIQIDIDITEWWTNNQYISTSQRFISFIKNQACIVDKKAVLCFDEIDSILNFSFSDDFFKCVRSIYNERSSDPQLNNITFVLIGLVPAATLIKNPRVTPFNVGKPIFLTDFSKELLLCYEAYVGKTVLERIFYWTSGQPYLTNKLITHFRENDKQDIDHSIKKMFCYQEIDNEPHLHTIQSFVLSNKNNIQKATLQAYKKIIKNQSILFEDVSDCHQQLINSGLVSKKNDRLFVRNRIYKHVFSIDWLKRNMPKRDYFKLFKILSIYTTELVRKLARSRRKNMIQYTSSVPVTIDLPFKRIEKLYINKKEIPVYNNSIEFKQLDIGKNNYNLKINTKPGEKYQVFLKVVYYPNWQICRIPEVTDVKTRDLNGKHQERINDIDFSSDGTKLISANEDCTLSLWNVKTNELICTFKGHQRSISCVRFSYDDKTIFSGSEDCNIIIWNLSTKNLTHILSGHKQKITCLACSQKNQLTSGSADNTAIVWDIEKGKKITQMNHSAAITIIEYSLNGNMILTASLEKEMNLWDSTTGKRICSFIGHKTWVYYAKFLSDDQKIVTIDNDNIIILWESLTGKQIRFFNTHRIPGNPAAAAVSPDCTKIISGIGNNTIQMWEIESGNKMFELSGHRDQILGAVFCSDGSKLLSWDWNELILWDVNKGNEYRRIKHTIRKALFSSDGDSVASIGNDRFINLWCSGKNMTIDI